MRIGVQLCRRIGMVRRVQVVRMGQMRMMRGRLMVAVLGMRGGFMVVLRRMFMMLGGVQMMFVSGFVCHCSLPFAV